MNVILNTDEVHTVLTLVTSQVLDNVELSAAAHDAVRDWRRDRGLDSKELGQFTLAFNESIGNYIDERTTRMLRVRGQRRVSEADSAR